MGRLLHPGPRWGGQLKRVIEQVEALQSLDARVVLVPRQAARLSDLFAEQDLLVGVQDGVVDTPSPRSISLVHVAGDR